MYNFLSENSNASFITMNSVFVVESNILTKKLMVLGDEKRIQNKLNKF